jgi:hypothetical protein
MPSSEIRVDCPRCGARAILTLSEALGTGETDQQLSLRAPCGHQFTGGDLLNLWAASHG